MITGTLAGVGVLVYWNFVYFPPGFTGWGEITSDRTISGWAINRRDATKRVEVQVYIDDQFVAYGVAELPRPDVVQAGWTNDPRCGYRFVIPALSPGEHVARIYAQSRVRDGNYVTLQMTGNPIKFIVNADGSIPPVK
jgi:hypothetical protein